MFSFCIRYNKSHLGPCILFGCLCVLWFSASCIQKSCHGNRLCSNSPSVWWTGSGRLNRECLKSTVTSNIPLSISSPLLSSFTEEKKITLGRREIVILFYIFIQLIIFFLDQYFLSLICYNYFLYKNNILIFIIIILLFLFIYFL